MISDVWWLEGIDYLGLIDGFGNAMLIVVLHCTLLWYFIWGYNLRTPNQDHQGFKSIIWNITISYFGVSPLWLYVKISLWLKFDSSYFLFHIPSLVTIKWGVFCLPNLYAFLKNGEWFRHYSYIFSFFRLLHIWLWYCVIIMYFLYSLLNTICPYIQVVYRYLLTLWQRSVNSFCHQWKWRVHSTSWSLVTPNSYANFYISQPS